MTLLLEKHQLKYTACYCEENIYLLCKYIQQNYPSDLERCTVVFISNENESFPMWLQKSSQRPDQLVVWDYHVILLVKSNNDTESTNVYDFDTTLPFPCPLTDYIDKSFKPHLILMNEYKRRFRLVSGGFYLQHFASDRSHMLSQDGTYLAPPPTWPPITMSDGNTLGRFRQMTLPENEPDEYGTVVLEQNFFSMI
ncbi:N-terminal glutamine amidase-domain-containing protein [Chlamydoabsidia padenii]|nr:N-terminal glutamine amidase-domain-containing protein [Chlamydoabsidia padenii]